MTDDVIEVARSLQTRSPRRIWGLSPESVYTSLAAVPTADSLRERLSPHIRAETLRTNDVRDRDRVTTVHHWMLNELGLRNEGELTLLGALVLTSENPRQILRSVAVRRLQGAETVLRSCVDIDESLPRREFDGLLADERDETLLGPLLGSFGFVTTYPDSVEPHHRRIECALAAQGELSTDRATAVAYAKVLRHTTEVEDEQCLEDVVETLAGEPLSEELPSRFAAAALANASPRLIDFKEIRDVLDEQRDLYEQQFDVLRSLLAPAVEHDVTRTEPEITVDDVPEGNQLGDVGKELLINVVATVAAHAEFATFDTEFVTNRLSLDSYVVYQSLSSIPGVECEVTGDSVVRFNSVPQFVEGEDLRKEYTTHLIKRCSEIRRWIDSLADVSVSPLTATISERMIACDYESLNDGDVAPAYFTYTLVDPDALGEKKMDDYVGDSRGLGRERARLERWHEERSSGLRSYTAMTDRLFSLGLERELDDRVLRVMTPFDDDTFNEYVAQIRRLLERGFELRLLTRHTKKPWEWRRLQRNLLSEIKEHRDRVTVRTYSRFKEQQRVTSDMDFRDIGEFGIHGKVQTIGHAEEGAALLGSANFMENSYDWNPECGVYTERTQFVDAAIEFFDIVWDISESDELAVERLQEIPNHQLVPTYYN